jgi:DNA primase
LTKRGFKTETLKKAGVGYAPPSYESVLKSAESRGISRKALEGAGLIIPSQKGGNPYDRFRNRITFPIVNLSGKTVGFGARALAEEDQPKYLNSPETPLYQKSRILYGLVVAREAIRKENRAIIVEGYMDWLTMVEAGIENVVAVSGTSLTDIQAKLLARFCERVTMMFDADAAGQRAALRGIDIAFNAALGVDIAVLPKGEDPDSHIRNHGVEGMRKILASATGIAEYRIESERARVPGGRLDFLAQEKLVKEFGELSAKIDDVTRRAVFLSEVRLLLGVDESTFRTALGKDTKATSPVRRKSDAPKETLVDRPSLLLRILLESPDYVRRARVMVLPDDFEHTFLRLMYEKLLAKTADGSWPTTPRELGDTPEEVEKWSRLLSYPVDPETIEKMLADALAAIAHDHRSTPQIKKLIEQAERIGDRETALRLGEEYARSMRLDKKEPASTSDGK